MPLLHFVGKVLPNGLGVAIPPHEVSFASPENSLTATFRIRIAASLINVECEASRFDPALYSLLYSRALDFVRVSVDLVAFATGNGLSVLLETVFMPDGTPMPIVPQDHHFAALCTAYKVNEPNSNFIQVHSLVATEPPLFMALNDLISAIILPHYGPVVAARAVETIRVLLAPAGTDAKKSWPYVHEKLRLTKNYLDIITHQSKGPRHGDRTFIPPNIVRDVVDRAWVVVNRYLEFRKRGGINPLPAAEFPLLQ